MTTATSSPPTVEQIDQQLRDLAEAIGHSTDELWIDVWRGRCDRLLDQRNAARSASRQMRALR